MLQRLRARPEWQFFAVLPSAHRGLAAAWFAGLLARGLVPAVFVVATGVLVRAVLEGQALAGPLALVGGTFVLMEVLAPVHQAVHPTMRRMPGVPVIVTQCPFRSPDWRLAIGDLPVRDSR